MKTVSKFIYRAAVVSGILFLGGISAEPIFAETTKTQDQLEEERADRIEDFTRKIGIAAGYAYQCEKEVNKDPDAAELIGDEALAVAEGILEDFGSTTAFLFASNTGYGAAAEVDTSKCSQFIGDWNKFVDEFLGGE